MIPVVEASVAAAEKVGTVAVEAAKKGIETAKGRIENIKNDGDAVKIKLNDIKNLTPEQLLEKMNEIGDEIKINESSDANEGEKEGLTDEDKVKIKKETGWYDERIDAIGSMEEYEIYKDAGLQEAEVGGKKCLIRNDIDWNQKDAMGRTNKERAEQGLSPINKNGNIIELHHIGQHLDSPLAELTPEEHRGKENDTILHEKTKESEIDRQAFARERCTHWETRANEGGNS